jgi:hypothetical protein
MAIEVIIPMMNHVWTIIDFNLITHIYSAVGNFDNPTEIVDFAAANYQYQFLLRARLCLSRHFQRSRHHAALQWSKR